MSDKYTQIKYVGNEEDNFRRINKFEKNELLGNDSWLLGFWVSLLAIVFPVLFAVLAGADLICVLSMLLKGSNISLLCVSTAISILASYSWNEKFMRDWILLLAFIFAADMIYGFISYAEYAKIYVNYCLMVSINILVALVMLNIMHSVYKLRAGNGD